MSEHEAKPTCRDEDSAGAKRPWYRRFLADEDNDWLRAEFGNPDYDYEDRKYSASGIFSRFGQPWSSYKDRHSAYAQALREAARTVNVVRQSLDRDQPLTVKWSTGKDTNGGDDPTIYLSPDIVSSQHSQRLAWTADQRNDALIGSALLAAGLKTTLPASTRAIHAAHVAKAQVHGMRQVASERDREAGQLYRKQVQLTETIWHAAETDTARRAVTYDFRGYVPYFKALIEYYTEANHKELIETQLATPNSKAAAELFAWNLLHLDDQITEVPEDYKSAQKLFKKLTKDLESEPDSDKRYRLIFDASEALAKMFPDPPKPEGQSNAGDNGADKTQFGQPIPNSVDKQLSRDEANSQEMSGTDIDTAIRERCTEIKAWQRSSDRHYASLLNEAKPLIEQLKHKLRFRPEKKDRQEPDYRSGELDEFALSRLCIDRKDDRLFTRREALGTPNVAFTLLVDMSSSMVLERRYVSARLLAVVLVETLRTFDGVHVAVLGHYSLDTCRLFHFYTPEAGALSQKPQALTQISAVGGTDEATAIAYTTRNAIKWFRGRVSRNILISLSDGGTNVEECHRQSQRARERGVEVFGVGIDNPYTPAQGQKLYGAGHFCIVGEPDQAIQVIGSFISRVATKGR